MCKSPVSLLHHTLSFCSFVQFLLPTFFFFYFSLPYFVYFSHYFLAFLSIVSASKIFNWQISVKLFDERKEEYHWLTRISTKDAVLKVRPSRGKKWESAVQRRQQHHRHDLIQSPRRDRRNSSSDLLLTCYVIAPFPLFLSPLFSLAP